MDNLAAYLVGLNRTITALSAAEVEEIKRLYILLNDADKAPMEYALKSKSIAEAEWFCTWTAGC